MTGSRYYRQKGGRAGRPKKIPTIRREGVGARVVVRGKRESEGGGGGQYTGTGKMYRITKGVGGVAVSYHDAPPHTHTLPSTTSCTGQARELSSARPLLR